MSAKRLCLYAFASLALLLAARFTDLRSQSVSPSSTPTSPPVAPVKPITDTYYGTNVVDPYRYMENLKDPQVETWIKAQNEYTRGVLASISGREPLLARIRTFDETVPQVGASRLPGDVYLITKRLPSEILYKLYVRRGLNGEDKLLVDPEQVKIAAVNQGKGKNAIQYSDASLDNKYVAVGIAPGGSERDTEMHIFETASGRETGDVVPRTWFGSVNWLPDNRSFVYLKLQKLPPARPPRKPSRRFGLIFTPWGPTPSRTLRCSATGWCPQSASTRHT